uniref:Uncharacterized protein n=1 Tax=Fagus sylvatica TaxID=28930 RepID=A0A2N9G7A8_FAGSY
MGHAAYRRKALDVLFPTIPVKRGMLSPANREFHVVAGVVIFPTHPGSHDQLVASGKTLRAKAALPMSDFDVLGTVGKLALPIFCKVPDSREIRAWTCEIWSPRTEVHRSVFGPFEGSFPIEGFRLDPDKILAIREFHVVHECVFFPTCPGSRINLLRVRKTLRASVATSVGKVPEISAQPYFVGLFSRAWYRPCTEASLGSQDMILRTEAVGMFLMPRVDPSRSENAWSTLGPNLVNPSQTWSNLREMCPGPSSWELFDVASPRRIRPAWFGLPRFACPTLEKIPGDFLGFRAYLRSSCSSSRFACHPFGVQMDIPGVVEDQTGYEEAVRGSKGVSLARDWGLARGHHARRVMMTPIDDPSSPTRPTGKHLSIPTLLFSFERSD